MKIKVDNQMIYNKVVETYHAVRLHRKLIYGSYAFTLTVLGYFVYFIVSRY